MMSWVSDFIDLREIVSLGLPRRMPRMEDFRLTNVHDDGPSADVAITSQMRYPTPTAYPPGITNAHGEVEMLGEVEATHWYVEADGITWHIVTTGSPDSEPFVIMHGLPESWYAFHNQMRDLSDRFYCIGVDVIGNGQSDKGLDLNYSYAGIANALAKLLDALGLEIFNLGGHDRGAVITDHLLNTADMQQRVLRYVRMQQSADEPHGEPRPPHKLFASSMVSYLMKWKGFPTILYTKSMYRINGIDAETLRRLDYEFKYKGIAEAAPLQFRTTSFKKELEDRHEFIFAKMTMPVLFLQGRNDPGQRPDEYKNTSSFMPNGRVQFIDANHFFHLEAHEATTAAMRSFLTEP